MKEHEIKIPHKVEIEAHHPAMTQIRIRLDGGDWTDWQYLKQAQTIVVDNEVPIKWVGKENNDAP